MHDARRAQRAFHAGEIGAFPETGGASIWQILFIAVVAGKNNDGVLAQAQFVQLVEEQAEITVELEQTISPIAMAASSPVFRAWLGRHMHQRIVVVDQEGFSILGALLQKIERALVHLDINTELEIEVDDIQFFYRFALAPLVHGFDTVTLGVVPRVLAPVGRVPRKGRAVPLVKAVVGGPTAFALANVPFAHTQRFVTRFGEEVAHGLFPSDETAGHARGRRLRVAGANRVATGHQRRTGWGCTGLPGHSSSSGSRQRRTHRSAWCRRRAGCRHRNNLTRRSPGCLHEKSIHWVDP